MISVYHPSYQDYFFGPEHPFSPTRYELVRTLIAHLALEPDYREPEPAAHSAIEKVHDPAYVEAVALASEGDRVDGLARYGFSATDTPPFAGMDEASRYMAGGSALAATLVRDGESDRALQLGGGLHHAHRSKASGFCIYNDLAVGIHTLLDAGMRVAYIDIDVHHGDGVQSIFYTHPDVLTISLHESGRYLYPGTGFPHELGEGAGEGLKLNVPLEPRTTGESYLSVFDEVVPHALSWFRPDVLVVQCGSDAHRNDPLAHLQLTTGTYEQLFRRLTELAADHANGRLIATLGGGYDFDATARIWTLLYLVLSGDDIPGDLPSAWRSEWSDRLGREFSPTLHDQPPRVATTENTAVAEANRQQAKQLLNRAARSWRK